MSEYIEIHGGRQLKGEVRISGAKNAALPMLIGSLLTPETCVFRNVPNLEDVSITIGLLEHFGAQVTYRSGVVIAKTDHLLATEASYSLVKALRASFWVLAPLLARGGAARVALPGGDAIGARPVDLHLNGLRKMGANIELRHGVVLASAPHGLRPAEIELSFPSVGATHQLLMAAALTPGRTILRGAACEPEVVALAEMLQAMGAVVEGAGQSDIVVHGQSGLKGFDIELIGDRIEAGTYLCMAAIQPGNSVKVVGVQPSSLGQFLEVLRQMGLHVETGADWVLAARIGSLRGIDIATGPFPKLATDLQAPLMSALCMVKGESSIEETIFEGRFVHVPDLNRMGAEISIDDRKARILGGRVLSGAPVDGRDIRGAAALVIAALAADGITQIGEIHHLRRGYANLESKLSDLGAVVLRRQSDIEDTISIGC